ncbi:MAG: hypothetical protein COV44_09165 [Deltaproteobacteria bacterium CG11_big_fil_rev_8_21_14_0_20_45_16]|nr:MAG: hypothetical protein COV44_09165 [Deltaproteobacteria bacterium CG11_big_fil_rev_8_21_14_0_20_45_16]
MKRKFTSGFSLIELMIAITLISFLGLEIAQYLKRQQATMLASEATEANLQRSEIVKRLFNEDLKNAVYIQPSCVEKPGPNRDVDRPCADVKIPSGFMIYPGAGYSDLNEATDLLAPANLEANVEDLTYASDAIRFALYDFEGSFNCTLSKEQSVNPSVTDEVGGEAERLWAGPECEDLIQDGQLYALVEMFDEDPYSYTADDYLQYTNVFQATDVVVDEGVEVQIDALSTDNLFNQPGGLGLSGYSNYARIYPIKLVEWAFDDGSGEHAKGLYRREIIPTAADPEGYQDWQLIDATVDGVQFYPVTLSSSGFVQHNRTMTFDGADEANDGMEDIRGVTARIVFKSTRSRTDGSTYDNPLTDTVEADAYPRLDTSFYVGFQNTEALN